MPVKDATILSENELNVLLKYIKSSIVEDIDREIVYRLVTLHYAELGFHEDPQDGVIKETIKLTAIGKKLINLSQIQKNKKALSFFNVIENVSHYI